MMNCTICKIISCCILLLCGCSANDQSVVGRWKAAELLDENVPSSMDMEDVYFLFSDDGTYIYQGNLKYREAGNYRREKRLLYTTDTLNEERVEKAVKIALLTEDSLHFLMNDAGNQQLFKLYKTD